MVDAFFIDDSRQRNPSRIGMGALNAIGGFHVPGHSLPALERELEDLCKGTGFPPGEVFKWSPDKEDWMRESLVEECRTTFFLNVLKIGAKHSITAIVAINDANYELATPQAKDHEHDVLILLLERCQYLLNNLQSNALAVAARPSGGSKNENAFLACCLDIMQEGTDYVLPERVVGNVVTAPFAHFRCLQLADLITSCTTAHVAGHTKYSEPLMPYICDRLYRGFFGGTVGGRGVKIHPDARYLNLYYWLFEDRIYWRGYMRIGLPRLERLYAESPNQP